VTVWVRTEHAVLGQRTTTDNADRVGRSQDLPDAYRPQAESLAFEVRWLQQYSPYAGVLQGVLYEVKKRYPYVETTSVCPYIH
jgi:hypothetical protein